MKWWGDEDCHLARFDIAPGSQITIDRALQERIVFLSFRGCHWSSTCRGASAQEAERSVVARNAGDIYSAKLEKVGERGGICREFYLSETHLDRLQRQCGLDGGIDFRVMHYDNAGLADMLFATHGAAEMGDRLAFDCHLLALVRAIAIVGGAHGETPHRPRNPHRIGRAIAWLRAHYDEPVSLADLADAAEMNPFVLIRSFKQHTGVPPQEYLRALRVNRARSLMMDGSSSAEAALMSGFADQSHMIRSFKRKTGLTPSATGYDRRVQR